MKTKHQTSRTRHQAGLSFVLVGIVVLLLFGFAGLVIDGTHAYDVRAMCQSTADAAALAAGMKLPDLVAAQAAALSFGTKNMDPLKHGTVVSAGDVVFGKWDFVAKTFTPTTVVTNVNAVRVSAKRATANSNALPLSFAKAIGYTSVDVQGKATAALGASKPWFVALTQDVTASFTDELAQAKIADQNLLNCFASASQTQSRFGIVTFTGWGQVHAPLSLVSTSYSALTAAVTGIKVCGSTGSPICSGTDIASGLQAATNMLTSAPVVTDAKKAIVLVSDGQPEPSTKGSHPTSTQTQLKALATQWANNADAAGISIFVVFYDADNNFAAQTFMQTLVRGEGIYLTTPTPSQIPVLLQKICSKLNKLQLVE
jgi:von Willebrand factor type A domain/Putative Tad-like Flp pilus-assembly